MFCDLVGSTPLSQRFDLEDLREIVGAYHRCVTDTVGRFGGFVAKYMGDGVLIYFGYPEAHKNDAERAARAGPAVIDAVGRLAPLKVRIGIASGLVVVGDLIGAGAAQERGVVGETPNLAGAGPTGHARCSRQHQESARHAVRDRVSRAPIPLPMLRHGDPASCCRVRFRARFPRRADVPFHTRCHRRIGPSCETQQPVEQRLARGSHRIVCHIPADELARLTAASERTAP
jgi:hypothetical protein